jgi:hypothetical protein
MITVFARLVTMITTDLPVMSHTLLSKDGWAWSPSWITARSAAREGGWRGRTQKCRALAPHDIPGNFIVSTGQETL